MLSSLFAVVIFLPDAAMQWLEQFQPTLSDFFAMRAGSLSGPSRALEVEFVAGSVKDVLTLS